MSTMTEQNKAIIQRFFDAWNSRQPDAFDDLVAPDVVRHCDATPGIEARSLDQVKEFLRQDTAVFPGSLQTIKLLVAEGDLVAAWTTYEGTQNDLLVKGLDVFLISCRFFINCFALPAASGIPSPARRIFGRDPGIRRHNRFASCETNAVHALENC